MLDRLIDTVKKNLKEEIIDITTESGSGVIYITISADAVRKVLMYIYKNIDCSLILLFANDEKCINGKLYINYVFAIKKLRLLLCVKAAPDKESLMISSVARDIPAAGLYEREIKDMFGVVFDGNPDGRELVFHENWPGHLHPLRKEFDTANKPVFIHKKQEFIKIEGEGVFEIPVGPVHAGIIEPGHFRFSAAGEPVINLEARLYYTHKGIEKLAEGMHFEKAVFLAERISGDETFCNSLAYCQAVEKIARLENIPERAKYTRTILAELERIYNHIGDIAGICTDVAFGFAAHQFNMMRNWCMALNEQLTGSRFLRSANKPGGVRKDYIKNNEKLILDNMNKLEKEFNETVEIIKSKSLFIDRVENTGVVKMSTVADLNGVGPSARAAGYMGDVRIDFPYAAYSSMNFEIPLHNNGDVNCRVNVKIEEVLEAVKIIKQAIELMPSGNSILEKITGIEPYKCAFSLTESPRGENCHFIMSGENNTIYRYKIRTPSFCNWPVLCHAVKGNTITDFPLINKSFNLSYSGNDL